MNGTDVKNGIYAGLAGGVIFLVLEMIMVPLFGGGSPWGPPRMIAAMVLGQDVLPPPADFNLGIVLTAMLVHFVISMIYGVILAAIIRKSTMGTGIAIGAVFGLTLYLVNFYGFTAIFPWFAEARNWISITAHIVFGISTAWVYEELKIKDENKVIIE